MNVRRWTMAAAAVLALGVTVIQSACGQAIAAVGVTLRVVPDHANGVYAAGETVRFLISATRDGKPFAGRVDGNLTLNGAKEVATDTLELANGEAVLTYTLKEPGCLTAAATLNDGGKEAKALAGAVVDPFKSEQSLPEPKDFDAFWDQQKRKLAEVPVNARLTPVEEDRKVNYGPAVECFDMQLDCLGNPASGYFCRPQGAKKKSLPAVLSLHSAGVRGGSLQASWNGAKRKMLAIDLNAQYRHSEKAHTR